MRQRRPERDRSRWFSHPSAQALMQVEQRALIPSITAVFGQAGLYIRPSSDAPPDLSGNMLQAVLRLHGDGGALDGDLRCDARCLPLADDSMSLVYVLHAFDICSDTSAMAREVARVLRPEGVAIVVGLNPWSPWSLRWAGRGPIGCAPGPLASRLSAQGLQVFRRSGIGPVWSTAERARERNGQDKGQDWLAPVRAGYALQARKRREGYSPLLPGARPALAIKSFAHTGCLHRR